VTCTDLPLQLRGKVVVKCPADLWDVDGNFEIDGHNNQEPEYRNLPRSLISLRQAAESNAGNAQSIHSYHPQADALTLDNITLAGNPP
jgi:hypothetical protein